MNRVHDRHDISEPFCLERVSVLDQDIGIWNELVAFLGTPTNLAVEEQGVVTREVEQLKAQISRLTQQIETLCALSDLG